jgi:hypothetical protein
MMDFERLEIHVHVVLRERGRGRTRNTARCEDIKRLGDGKACEEGYF